MKKLLLIVLLIFVCGFAAEPVIENTTGSDRLTFSNEYFDSESVVTSGFFYDAITIQRELIDRIEFKDDEIIIWFKETDEQGQ